MFLSQREQRTSRLLKRWDGREGGLFRDVLTAAVSSCIPASVPQIMVKSEPWGWRSRAAPVLGFCGH